MTRRRFLVLMLTALPALLVAACGRKEQPEHPPGSRYPRTYPKD